MARGVVIANFTPGAILVMSFTCLSIVVQSCNSGDVIYLCNIGDVTYLFTWVCNLYCNNGDVIYLCNIGDVIYLFTYM